MSRINNVEKSERELLRDISDKLQQLVGLQAAQGKTEDQSILILRGMDFDWNFIGAVTGMKPKSAAKRHERLLHAQGKQMAKPKQTEMLSPEVRELVAIKRLLIFALLKSGTSQNEIAKALAIDPAILSKMMPAKQFKLGKTKTNG